MTDISVGERRRKLRTKNCQDVYDAIYHIGGEVKLRQIMDYLNKQTEELNLTIEKQANEKFVDGGYSTKLEMSDAIKGKIQRTISERTVERCIQNDSPIMSNGKKHFLSDTAKLESRYLNPEYFGLQMFRHTMRFDRSKSLEKKVRQFVTRFGVFIFFNFLEAVRPFKDDSISAKERENLVEIWVQDSFPVLDMLLYFQGSFDYKGRERDRNTPFREMKEERIEEISAALQRSFPEIYEDLINGRKETFGKTVKERFPGVIIDTYHDKLYGLDKTSVNPHKRS